MPLLEPFLWDFRRLRSSDVFLYVFFLHLANYSDVMGDGEEIIQRMVKAEIVGSELEEKSIDANWESISSTELSSILRAAIQIDISLNTISEAIAS